LGLRLIANFNNWTSGNNEIDAFIQQTQKTASYRNSYLEWVDPQEITNIKLIADRGFGSVYQATWMNAPKRFGDRIKEGNVTLNITNGDMNTFFNEFINKVNALYNN
jgi:hypothetical protein